MSDSVWDGLRARFPAPEYAYFPELRNGTGFSRRVTRSADAVAFSLWPSRGLELHGIEVKVSRSDWLREKKDPAKAEEIGRFCHRWWLATGPKVVLDVGEIPDAWGWLELDGKKLKQRKEAPRREAQPLDLPMLASMFRNIHEQQSDLVRAEANRKWAADRQADVERTKATLDQLGERVAKAEEQRGKGETLLRELGRLLGVEFVGANWSDRHAVLEQVPPELAEAIKTWRQIDLQTARATLQQAAMELRRASAAARLMLRSVGVRAAEHRMRRYG